MEPTNQTPSRNNTTAVETTPASTSSTKSSPSRKKRNQTSFTADSPYFTAYVDKEMKNLNVLTTTLRDISSKAKTFGKCGVLMSEATRRLSSACKLHPNGVGKSLGSGSNDGDDISGGGSFDEKNLDTKERNLYEQRKKSVGNEMVGVLEVLGKVLDEVADAQISMCEALEASLSLSLEAFIGTELEQATRLKQEAEEMTENAESAFAKYLHGKNAQNSASAAYMAAAAAASANSGGFGGNHTGINAGGGGGNGNSDDVSSWNKLSENVGNQLGRIGITTANNDSSLSPIKGRKGKKNNADRGKDPMDEAISAAYLKQNLEEIRYSQANAELKRFELLKHVDALKTRQNFGLGESILASLNGIKAYFHHCSDMIQGLTPILQNIQNEQTTAREQYESQLKPLEVRERGLNQAINEVKISAANAGVIADAISRGQATGLGASMIADQPTSLEAIEEETKIWDLTRLLTKHSLYIRDPKPTVEVEGWLYKKASTRMAMNTWSKRWFVLDKTGIYYLKGGSLSENKKIGSTNGSLERVKVCDIVLCTVREVGVGMRFCFEILSPNSRPYMLQACGPLEYKKWVIGIRKCLERQLVQGNLPSDDMLLKKDTPKSRRSTKDGFKANSSEENDTPLDLANNDDISMSDSVSTMSTMQSAGPKNPLVKQILSANPICADCGQKRPEWVSLNLGVLVCIECSGVHRSLGVHLSKVRSLRLDQLTDAEYTLVNSLGNDYANSVWEGGVNNQSGWNKPNPNDSRKTKEEWIKSKYVWKGFITYKDSDGKNQEEREKTFTKELFNAASRCDVRATAAAIAKGGNINWVNQDEGGQTPLHACILSKRNGQTDWNGIETAELLAQNGAKIDTSNNPDQTVMNVALVDGVEEDMAGYIMKKYRHL